MEIFWILVLIVLSPLLLGIVLLGLQKKVRIIHSVSGIGLSQLIFPFLYNRQYMNRMLTSGWALDTLDPNYEIAKEKLDIVS
jgi:hypothetical protein